MIKLIGSYKLPKPKPILGERNMLKRFEYCNIHKNDKFTNVIFSDESKFMIFANS